MKKSILNTLILAAVLSVTTVSQAVVFTCPTLKPNEIYFYFDWVDTQGNKIASSEWNQGHWRIWINGDNYLTPNDLAVSTAPLAVHYFPSTNTWYLKCTSADLSVGPRNNVWPYTVCQIQDNGFKCE